MSEINSLDVPDSCPVDISPHCAAPGKPLTRAPPTANLHQPATLLSYLMVWLGCPEAGGRGHYTLQLMEGMVNQINTGLAELWDLRLPELTEKLNG